MHRYYIVEMVKIILIMGFEKLLKSSFEPKWTILWVKADDPIFRRSVTTICNFRQKFREKSCSLGRSNIVRFFEFETTSKRPMFRRRLYYIRVALKRADFWFRSWNIFVDYLSPEPVVYGPYRSFPCLFNA